LPEHDLDHDDSGGIAPALWERSRGRAHASIEFYGPAVRVGAGAAPDDLIGIMTIGVRVDATPVPIDRCIEANDQPE
jgi:hypothetical protein